MLFLMLSRSSRLLMDHAASHLWLNSNVEDGRLCYWTLMVMFHFWLRTGLFHQHYLSHQQLPKTLGLLIQVRLPTRMHIGYLGAVRVAKKTPEQRNVARSMYAREQVFLAILY